MKKITIIPMGIFIYLAMEIFFPIIFGKKILFIENALWLGLGISFVALVLLQRPKAVTYLEAITIVGLIFILIFNRVNLIDQLDMKNIINPLSFIIISGLIISFLLSKKSTTEETISKTLMFLNNLFISIIALLIIVIILNNYNLIDIGLFYIKPYKLLIILGVNISFCSYLNGSYKKNREKEQE